jgi:Tol biopolymer transport system component
MIKCYLILNMQSKLLNIFSLIVSMFFVINFYGCDPCTGTNPEENNSSKYIYFSSVPINSTLPNIYRVNYDGTRIIEILKNGIIFSPPSKDNKICFLRNMDDSKKAVFICNTNGENLKQISADDFWKTLDLPVLSPDGKYIAVYTGNNDLYLATSNGSYWRPVTSSFFRNSLPSFSPDGSLLAYYESKSLAVPWKLKVVNTSKLQDVVFEKSFSIGLNQWYGDATINWSSDGKKIFYVATNDNLKDVIWVKDLINGEEEEFEIDYIGATMPNSNLKDNLLAFVGKDGNIWTREYKSTDVKYNKYTSSDSLEINLYPNFSGDGKKIIYNRYFKDDYGLLKSSLMLFDINSRNFLYLCDNAYRGFWGN